MDVTLQCGSVSSRKKECYIARLDEYVNLSGTDAEESCSKAKSRKYLGEVGPAKRR